MRLSGLVVGVCLIFAQSSAKAAPPIDTGAPRGRADRFHTGAMARLPFLRAPGVDAAEQRSTAAIGTYKCVVILLQFSDNPADTLNHTPADFEDLLFSVGTRPGGSFRDYYREASRGQFDVEGIVTRWYMADSSYGYYTDGQSGFGAFPRNAAGMAADAIKQANPDVDFSQFDANGSLGVPDGIVDGLFVVHAGPGAEETGNLGHIWSHKFNLPGGLPVDGTIAFTYTTEPEEWAGVSPQYNPADSLISRGVFCHEFGHILGLPDIYDLTPGPTSSEGVGEWDLMATGVYNHLSTEPMGTTPAHPSAWSKIQLGWVTPTWVLQDSAGVTIPPVETSGQVFRLWTNGEDAGQYFLVENRQPIGSDAGLVRSSNEAGDGASHGLIIYHVDDAIQDNNNPAHKLLDVEEAGGPEFLLGRQGAQNLDLHRGSVGNQLACGVTISVTGNRGDKYDPWPGARNATSFDGSCPPSGSYCNGRPSQVAVRNIVESGNDVTADFFVNGVTVHRLAVAVDDTPFNGFPNNGNGLVEPGETVRLRLPLRNYAFNATGPLTAKLTAASNLVLDPDSITYASISPSGVDSGTVVQATVLPTPDPLGVTITMALETAAGIVDADSFQVLVGTTTGLCDHFENTARHWISTANGCDGVDEWHREALGVNHTPGGAWSWRLGPDGTIGSYALTQDARLVSQPIRLAGVADTLVFWQRYDTQVADDGLSVEISTDGGETWALLNPVGGYSSGDRWAGFQPTFVEARVPLAGYSGVVQVSFRFRSSPPGLGLGWWIDDVAVTGDDQCATTAVQVTRFEAGAVPGRAAVRVSWGLADAVGATVAIDRAATATPRQRIATLPWDDRNGEFEDTGVVAGLSYRYWLTASRPGEPDATAGPVLVDVPSGLGGGAPPRVLSISRIRPNPFSPHAEFSVSLDRDGPYVVRVYRADGSLVRTLADSHGRQGILPMSWDGTDGRGRPAGAGLYFFELRTASGVRVQKAILLR